MKKRLIGISFTMIMFLVVSVQAFAAELAESSDVKGEGIDSASIPIANEAVLQDGEKFVQPKFPGNAKIIGVKVYAADSIEKKYYTAYYTNMTPETSSYCNGTLGPKTAELYRNNNCDSFYVQVTVDKSTAAFYELYDGDVLLSEGYCGGGAPNTYKIFSMLIKNNNPGRWELVLKDMGEDRGVLMWGDIRLPAE